MKEWLSSTFFTVSLVLWEWLVFEWLLRVCWWRIFFSWELSDQFSSPVLPTNIKTNILLFIILFSTIPPKASGPEYFETIDHLPQHTQTLSKIYPDRLITIFLPSLESYSFPKASCIVGLIPGVVCAHLVGLYQKKAHPSNPTHKISLI